MFLIFDFIAHRKKKKFLEQQMCKNDKDTMVS